MKRVIRMEEDDIKTSREVEVPCFRWNGHIFYCIPESGDSIAVSTSDLPGIAWTCFENSLGRRTSQCSEKDFKMAYRQTLIRLNKICFPKKMADIFEA
jgi:hypothetical protein